MGFIRPSAEMNNVSDKMDSLVAKGNEFASAAASAATMAKTYVPSFTPSASDLATIESAKSSIQSALTSVKDSMSSAISGYQDAALEMQRKMKKLDVPMNKVKPPKLDAIYKDCAQMSIKGAINALPVPDLASLSCMKSLAA